MLTNLEIIEILWSITLSGLIVFMAMRFYLASWWKKQRGRSKIFQDMKVKVIVPCKGVDLNMEHNIKCMKEQNYENFHLVAVVDSFEDDACKILKANNIDFVLAKESFKGSGKVRAISTAIEDDKESNIFVIVDSDTTVNSDWLGNLIAPLKDKSVGVVSTYPIYEPIHKIGFWDYIKKIWGYVGINMMEFRITRFVWGGSVAFRREFLGPQDFIEFSRSISDDAVLTKICKEKSLRIAYSKEATPLVYTDETRESFMEWSNRQIAISISYSKTVFYAALVIYGLTILYLIALIPLSIFVGNFFLLGYIPLILLISFNMHREGNHSIKIAIATVFIPFIYLYNIFHSRTNKEINWRGNIYKLNDKET